MVARTVHSRYGRIQISIHISKFHAGARLPRCGLGLNLGTLDLGADRTSFATNRNRKHFWSELFDTALLFGCRISCIYRCRHNGEVYYYSLMEVDVREQNMGPLG